jgi:hypothetical protein
VERTFAHLCETGRARRSWLCGLEKVQKRYLMHAAARNLSLAMRKLFKMGTPRSLQDAGDDALARLYALLSALRLLAALQRPEASLRAAKIQRRRRSNPPCDGIRRPRIETSKVKRAVSHRLPNCLVRRPHQSGRGSPIEKTFWRSQTSKMLMCRPFKVGK